jgi:hypothetical protein
VVHVRAAVVAPGGGPGDAVHAAAAEAAAQQVGPLGRGVGGQPVGAGAVLGADALSDLPGGPGDNRWMHWLGVHSHWSSGTG